MNIVKSGTPSSKKSLQFIKDNQDNEIVRLEFVLSGRIQVQVFENLVMLGENQKKLKTFYVARIRGIVIGSDDSKWLQDTPEEAYEFGVLTKKHWQKRLDGLQAQNE